MAKKDKEIEIDHSQPTTMEACGMTPERCMELGIRYNPVHWADHPEEAGNNGVLTQTAEEIVKLPKNEAVFVISTLINTIIDSHPKCIEFLKGALVIQFSIAENSPKAQMLKGIEQRVRADTGLPAPLVRQKLSHAFFEIGMDTVVRDGTGISISIIKERGADNDNKEHLR